MRILLACLLFFSSFSVYADNYNAPTMWSHNSTYFSTQSAGCTSLGVGPYGSPYHYVIGNSSTACDYVNATGGATGQTIFLAYGYVCPAGGSLQTGTPYICAGAPSCTSTQFRNATTQICQNMVVCTPPEHDNGFGICGVAECTSAQVLNPSSGVCQTPPTCGSTQAYDAPSNTCFLKTLDCPNHSHASTANDKCLADAPMACPSGQHDDGTYICVADNAVGCSANQTRGYINGSLQCITKPNAAMFAKQAADAAANAAVKSSAEIAANAANQTAQQNLAANPTDPATIAAATAAGNAQFQAAQDSLAASRAASAANNTSQSTDQLAAAQSLDSIDKSLTNMTAGTGKTFTLQTAGVFSDATVNTAVDSAKADFNTQFQSISSQVQSLFTFTHSGSGSLPSFDYGTIFHVHVVADLNNYAVPLSYVGLTVMFLAAYISVRIFME
jgi:hypothetical protein